MHTKITAVQLTIWLAIIAGQILVGLFSWRRRNSALAAYLGIEASLSVIQFAVARLCSAHAYLIAYSGSMLADYGAMTFLVVWLYLATRRTGIPNRHGFLLQIVAVAMFALAILTLPFPLANTPVPWRWYLAVDHVVFYWLCLMLMMAPLYAWLVDSAKDSRLLLVYLGFSLYVAVRAGVIDLTISSHLKHRFSHVSDLAYLLSLVLWFCSSRCQQAKHQWDPAQTELLKAALRSRSHIHEHSILRKVPLI